ncbi:DNA polymerase III subunit delta' [Thermodesulfobacteriota bacterium]
MSFIPFKEIIGQEKAIGFLKGVMARQRVPHAYLFTGIAGIGKSTTAVAFAQAINCLGPAEGEGCGKCQICRQVAHGNFPDLAFVAPDGQHIKIEQIRDLNRALSFRPLSGGYRVSIIQKAETMTKEAANSFLKTLEEPPDGNILILNVTEPRALLPTIVSRCQKVLFSPIHFNTIEHWLVDKFGIKQEQAKVLAKVSEGSLGRAIRMNEGDFFERRQEYLHRLIQLPASSKEQALQLATEWSQEEKSRGKGAATQEDRAFIGLLNVWKSWYRDLLLMKTKGPAELLINMDFSNKLKKTAGSFTIKRLWESLLVLERAHRDLLMSRNVDLTIENTLLSLKRLYGLKE